MCNNPEKRKLIFEARLPQIGCKQAFSFMQLTTHTYPQPLQPLSDQSHHSLLTIYGTRKNKLLKIKDILKNHLKLPPSTSINQSIAIPPSKAARHNNNNYPKTFKYSLDKLKNSSLLTFYQPPLSHLISIRFPLSAQPSIPPPQIHTTSQYLTNTKQTSIY